MAPSKIHKGSPWLTTKTFFPVLFFSNSKIKSIVLFLISFKFSPPFGVLVNFSVALPFINSSNSFIGLPLKIPVSNSRKRLSNLTGLPISFETISDVSFVRIRSEEKIKSILSFFIFSAIFPMSFLPFSVR